MIYTCASRTREWWCHKPEEIRTIQVEELLSGVLGMIPFKENQMSCDCPGLARETSEWAHKKGDGMIRLLFLAVSLRCHVAILT